MSIQRSFRSTTSGPARAAALQRSSRLRQQLLGPAPCWLSSGALTAQAPDSGYPRSATRYAAAGCRGACRELPVRHSRGLWSATMVIGIQEHFTDTGGASDHVFGLFALIGKRFAPRLRNLKDRKFHTFEKRRCIPSAVEPHRSADPARISSRSATFTGQTGAWTPTRLTSWRGAQDASDDHDSLSAGLPVRLYDS